MQRYVPSIRSKLDLMLYVDGGATLRQFVPKGARLLDIGCGTGRTVSVYRQGMEDVEIHGIDGYADPALVDPAIRFVKQDVDGTKLPYADGSFDVAVLAHVLEHVRNPVHLIDEAFRVLKPGGVIYVETPSIRSLFVPQLTHLNEQYTATNFFDDYTHVGRPQTVHSLYHLLNRHGFDVVTLDYARPRNWVRQGLRSIASGLKHRQRYAINTGIWHLVGWALYAVARRADGKVVAPHV
ncbi:MAG: class I SAM-dependent methyltransferase [Polyangiales bacterium]